METTPNTTARQRLRSILDELAQPNAWTSTETIGQIVYAIDHATDEQVVNFIEWFDESRGTDTMQKFLNGHYSYAENFGDKMIPERVEDILQKSEFEVECFRNERNERTLSLRHYGGALSEGVGIVFVESENHTPRMDLRTFDSEMVEVNSGVTEVIADCIVNFSTVWNYFYQKGTTK